MTELDLQWPEEAHAVFATRHVPLGGAGAAWVRALDVATTFALGQRVTIVGPVGSGRSTVARAIAAAIVREVPTAHIDALLIDQPPDEPLEWTYDLPTVVVHASSHDDPPHVHAAVDHVFAEARDRALAGGDSVIFIDSLANLGRALNVTMPEDERVLTGGLMQTALRSLRTRFGQARQLADGGSVTVIGIATAEGESELDDVIAHELVGTGTMEIHLSREVKDAGLFPPIDLDMSGARHVELIIGEARATRIAQLRSIALDRGAAGGLAMLLGEIELQGTLDDVLDRFVPEL